VTVVLRLIREAEIEANRQALCDWLNANSVDPKHVVDHWLSIERDDDQTVIRYQQYRTTEDGSRLVDPDDDSQAWSEELAVPLVVELKLPPAKTLSEPGLTVTKGDG
jgi:hypothetical protein